MSTPAAPPAVPTGAAAASPGAGATGHYLLRAARRPVSLVVLVWLGLVGLASLFAGVVARHDPLAQDLQSVYSGPSGQHWLGTDQLGRDIFSRILFGGRVSLLVVLEAVLVYLLVGVLIGVVAGYLGGQADRTLMRFTDLLQSMPAVVILLVVLAIFSRNETAAMVTLGFLASAGLARVVRASAMTVRAEPFVAAARVAGLSTPMILRRHVLPQIAGPVIVLASILAGQALLVETALDFLGLGVQAPAPSWGGLVGDASQAIYRQPWMLVPAGGTILLTAVAFGLLGDVVRDASADRGSTAGSLSWRRMRTRVTRAQGAPAVTGSHARNGQVLTVRGLTVRLPGAHGPVTIVDRLDLDVAAGETVGLVGESGCGKTMAISGLMRLLPAGGELTADVLHFGVDDLLKLDEGQMARIRGSRIGFISQEPVGSLDPAYTVGSQLREVIRHHHRMTREAADTRAVELLASVGLPEPSSVMAKYPHELSGGMAQRVSIARTLAGEPELLIADEPTTALDVTVQAGILDLLRDICRDRGMALILVTHDWGVIADLCTSAVVMYAGQAVEQADILTIFQRPRHPYTAALLAADPGNTARGRLPAIPGTVTPPGQWSHGCRFAARCVRATEACTAKSVPLITDTDGDTAYRCVHPLTPGSVTPTLQRAQP